MEKEKKTKATIKRHAIITPLIHLSININHAGQQIARRTNAGSQQHGQYNMPSLQPGSGFSCQALLGPELEEVLEPEEEEWEEPDYDLLPDSVFGPLR